MVARIGSTNLAHWPHMQERSALELGLEGFLRAPSRPVPIIRADAAKLFLPPRKGNAIARGGEMRPPVLALAASTRASLVRKNANQEEFGTIQILPEGADFHKAIINPRERNSPCIFN